MQPPAPLPLYVPAWQLVQLEALPVLKVPGLQVEHDDAPVPLYLPASHATQDDWPELPWKVPAEHWLQPLAPAPLKVPALHAVHEDAPAPAKVPALHRVQTRLLADVPPLA